MNRRLFLVGRISHRHLTHLAISRSSSVNLKQIG